jgi:hypothetical protein
VHRDRDQRELQERVLLGQEWKAEQERIKSRLQAWQCLAQIVSCVRVCVRGYVCVCVLLFIFCQCASNLSDHMMYDHCLCCASDEKIEVPYSFWDGSGHRFSIQVSNQ